MGDVNPIKPSHAGLQEYIESPIGQRGNLFDLTPYGCENGLYAHSRDFRSEEFQTKHLRISFKLLDSLTFDRTSPSMTTKVGTTQGILLSRSRQSFCLKDVRNTSDRCLIDLETQVQRLMEAHLALTQPTQVNKITTSCEIFSGPHDTQYCMEDPEQAFIEIRYPHVPMMRELLGSQTFEALVILGSCVINNTLYLFKKLNIGLLEETDHIFGLADGTKSYPVGIVKNVEVHIGKLKLLNDFYLIDMKKDPETPLLVGRGFLATANAVIDCRMAKIAVGEGITRYSAFGRTFRGIHSGWDSILEKKRKDYGTTYTQQLLKNFSSEDETASQIITGWVFLLGGGAISLASKKQTCITGSTMEYEFIALAAACKEAEWLKILLLEIPLWSKPIFLYLSDL
ncbi:MAK10-like protein [Tanacetum coccineum]